jgi:hypothetical protein
MVATCGSRCWGVPPLVSYKYIVRLNAAIIWPFLCVNAFTEACHGRFSVYGAKPSKRSSWHWQIFWARNLEPSRHISTSLFLSDKLTIYSNWSDLVLCSSSDFVWYLEWGRYRSLGHMLDLFNAYVISHVTFQSVIPAGFTVPMIPRSLDHHSISSCYSATVYFPLPVRLQRKSNVAGI